MSKEEMLHSSPRAFLLSFICLSKTAPAGPTPVTPTSSSQFLPVARTESTPVDPALTILPHQALLDIADVGEEVAHCCDLRDRGKEGGKKKEEQRFETFLWCK